MSKTPEHPRKALGRGLGSLIPTRTVPQPPQPAEKDDHHVAQLTIDNIYPNPLQPRRDLQTERL